MYGTTLRIYDPHAGNWRIIWADPVRQSFTQMIGRASGADIVQDSRGPRGDLTQWCFTEIAADSFHWIARESTDEGRTWTLTGEFFLGRRKAGDGSRTVR